MVSSSLIISTSFPFVSRALITPCSNRCHTHSEPVCHCHPVLCFFTLFMYCVSALRLAYTALLCCQGYIVCCFNLVVGAGLTAVCQTRGCSCASCHVLAAEPSEQLLSSLQAALLSDSHSEPSGQSRLGNLLSRLSRSNSNIKLNGMQEAVFIRKMAT